MAPNETRTIKLQAGSVLALKQGDIVRARGVKYATASRFELPQPIGKWEGVIDCTKPAPICPQRVPSRLDFVTGPINQGRFQNEDCLHVTITTLDRQLTGRAKVPVMVFLHGGAYLSGAGDIDCYEPSALVAQGVVVVNVTYRLGIFGYMPIPKIAPANLGLFDQIAALRWIQDNIDSFGGDRNNVTLFGESAGADSIQCLMLAEGTDTLFHKAILQSAPVGIRYETREPMVTDLSNIASEELARDGAFKTTEEMISLQTKLLIAAQKYSASRLVYGPVLGSAPLPKLSETSQQMNRIAQKIPIMIGYTRDEGRPFVQMADNLRTYINLPLIGGYINSIFTWLFSGQIFKWPSQSLHRQYLKAGGHSTLYEFNWRPLHSPLGGSHCIDLPFLLGSWDSWKEAPMLGGPSSREDVQTLGTEMRAVWLAFSRSSTKFPQKLVIDKGFRYDSVML